MGTLLPIAPLMRQKTSFRASRVFVNVLCRRCKYDSALRCDARRLVLLGLAEPEFLPVAGTETPPSLAWSAAIQDVKSKEDPAGLTPKSCFISAEAVERVVGQIRET